MPYDVIELAQKLISFPSVTPKDEGVQLYLAEKLSSLGFECFHLPFSEGDETVSNLFARIGTNAPHICYAGHTDVVSPGPVDKWTYGPFDGHIENNVLYGRGASDMKGSVAAFLAAVSSYLEHNTLKGSISFLITGDEEGPAINGTRKVLEWMEENGHIPDVCLVGEPTNPDHLGQAIKIGRRGSLNTIITVQGKQGHVAYQHLADNPAPKIVKMLDALNEYIFDEGSETFQPTNLEVTTIDLGDIKDDNIIRDSGRVKFNIRFNDLWTSKRLVETLHKILKGTGYDYDMRWFCDGESSLTEPGIWTQIVQDAVNDVTNLTPALTTSGGTSDARFISRYCPVVEFGGINRTIHKIDENARVKDLRNLAKIFERLIERTDKAPPNCFS
ncbi:MAG: succinyl-diaminopimelate desuccinylase [Alphaproteobacteria bacterium]|nr:succinyl-diaminopimelate desuccinylase [Alphaproteobacteria bacterium]